jgi:hypothetical protein
MTMQAGFDLLLPVASVSFQESEPRSLEPVRLMLRRLYEALQGVADS